MARKINAGDDMKRSDFLLVDPFQVEVKEELRGRHKPVTEEDIIEMAVSMATYKQRQPVECRVIEGNRLQLNLGFTRTNAARLLREGFEHEGTRYHDPKFLLKAMVVDCNDQEAFLHNVVENAHRKQTSDVDDAYNQRTLREDYGMKNAEIARLYRCGQNRVADLQKLLQADQKTLDLVHDGTLSLTGALDLLSVPTDEREKVLDEAEKTKAGKIKGTSVRSVVREHILNDNNKPKTETQTTKESEVETAKPRSAAEIRKFFQEWADSEEPALACFANDFLKWAAGKTTDKAMDNAMYRVLDAQAQPEEAEAA